MSRWQFIKHDCHDLTMSKKALTVRWCTIVHNKITQLKIVIQFVNYTHKHDKERDSTPVTIIHYCFSVLQARNATSSIVN